jgi:hypothetical protein
MPREPRKLRFPAGRRADVRRRSADPLQESFAHAAAGCESHVRGGLDRERPAPVRGVHRGPIGTPVSFRLLKWSSTAPVRTRPETLVAAAPRLVLRQLSGASSVPMSRLSVSNGWRGVRSPPGRPTTGVVAIEITNATGDRDVTRQPVGSLRTASEPCDAGRRPSHRSEVNPVRFPRRQGRETRRATSRRCLPRKRGEPPNRCRSMPRLIHAGLDDRATKSAAPAVVGDGDASDARAVPLLPSRLAPAPRGGASIGTMD